MKYLAIASLLFSINSFALVCDELGTLNSLDGSSCLSDQLSKEELESMLTGKDDMAEFCQNCKSPLLENILKDKAAPIEKKAPYGEAVLNEFQKELSFISMDLMKVRSSFKLDFDPKDAITKCDINKQLETPKCLKGSDLTKFNERIGGIKSALANELVNVLSNNPALKNGLFERPEKSACGLNDTDVSNAQTRYSETLLTPTFILKLKALNIPSGTTYDLFIKKNKAARLEELGELGQNPLFQALLRNTTNLNQFLKEIEPGDDNKKIIERLYSPQFAKLFGTSISNRCDSAFKKTSKYLDEVFCKEIPYTADDLQSMQAVSGTDFKEMTDHQAENELKAHCSYLNVKKKDAPSFTAIRFDINGNNSKNLINMPITQFKKESFKKIFSNHQESICSAMKDENLCKIDSNSASCQMLKFYKLSKTDKNYQDMAKASGDNINLILRSLVGSGLPQKDGKIDSKALVLLQNEGILPGGSPDSRPVQKDASTFHKVANAGNAGGNTQSTNPTQQPQSTKDINPGSNTFNAASTNDYSDASDDEDVENGQSGSKKHKKNIDPKSREFSNLSQNEQDEIMKRLGKLPSRKKQNGSKLGDSQEQDASFESHSNLNGRTPSFNAGAQTNGNATTTQVRRLPDQANIPKNPNPVEKDGSDKKKSSINQAMLNSQNYIANGGKVEPIENHVTVTENTKGEKEIQIDVEDKELSKVNEFTAKLTQILDAQSQNLQRAREGDKFLVKLGNYKISVFFNMKSGIYEATCSDNSIPKGYLETLSKYFTRFKNQSK